MSIFITAGGYRGHSGGKGAVGLQGSRVVKLVQITFPVLVFFEKVLC